MAVRKEKIERLWMRILDTVLPPRCPVTGDIVDAQGMVSSAAWAKLNFIADPMCRCCGVPFDFDREDVGDGGLCMACLRRSPAFVSARAPLVYDEASRDLILAFKHGDKPHIVPSFIPWLLRAGEHMIEGADYFVPVPLHRRRLIARRYNQAAIMAHELSRVSGVDVLPAALLRVRSTPSQGHLSHEERKKNVNRAFRISNSCNELINNKNIVLVDDVFTTGATANECVKTLMTGGAKRVDVLTLARVLRDDF